ncbi:MAG: M48 family metalloprotease [Nanoarchaeota archaeon]
MNGTEAFLHYLSLFTQDQFTLMVLVSSIALAIFILGLVKFGGFDLKQKMMLIYTHIVLLIFPFVFILFDKACQQQIFACQGLKTYAFGIPTILISMLLLAIISGYLIVPLFYRNKNKSLIMDNTLLGKFIREKAKQLGWKQPSVYAFDAAKPFAFAFSQLKPSIFISVGMMELLTKKEIEAVMLHELWHTRSQSTLYKISAFASRLSPFAAFSGLENNLSKEEIDADEFAIRMQRTDKYLLSAKEKIGFF